MSGLTRESATDLKRRLTEVIEAAESTRQQCNATLAAVQSEVTEELEGLRSEMNQRIRTDARVIARDEIHAFIAAPFLARLRWMFFGSRRSA